MMPPSAANSLASAFELSSGRRGVFDPYPRVRVVHLLGPLKTALPLAAADALASFCCVCLATVLTWAVGESTASASVVSLAFCAGMLIGLGSFGLYPGIGINPVNETRLCVIAASAVASIALVTLAATRPPAAAYLLLGWTWLLAIFLVPIGRMAARSALGRWRWWRQPIAILGDSENAQRVAARLRRWRTLGLEPVGHVNHLHEHWADRAGEDLSYIGPPQEVADLIEQQGVHWAILAVPGKEDQDQAELLSAAFLFPNVLLVDEASTLPSLWSRTVDIDGSPGRHSYHRFGLVPRRFKRTLDVVLAGLLLLVCAPLFLLIGALIRASSRGPIFYTQERIGRGGRTFRAWKFRTMVSNADGVLADYFQAHPELRDEWEKQHKLKQDPRIIPGIGHFLRFYSLDELPQLWNVLCGQMSLVGPRPIVEAEIPKYQGDFALYIQVSPGVTGLWQISGRNNTTYQRRVFLDSYYIRNWSPWLDYHILLRTIKTVVLREGAY
jgi:Undecaprenyl-phosphate galactose phosphotransferase WbaP